MAHNRSPLLAAQKFRSAAAYLIFCKADHKADWVSPESVTASCGLSDQVVVIA
jgi:hypothetical protein